MITCRSPPPSLLKNPQLNYETNTGYIYKVKNYLKRCLSQLSNASKKAENGPELVEITCRSPPSFLKNSNLNCKTNTGHIYKFKHPPENCNL